MSDEVEVRHRHTRHESGLRRFWRSYHFELLWLFVVALGLFLLLERLSLRELISGWFTAALVRTSGTLRDLDSRLPALMAQISPSDVAGFILMLGAAAAILFRVRYRLLNAPSLSRLACPACGGRIHRIHRTTLDRVVCLYLPVRRYRCHNADCRWHGLRVGSAPAPDAHHRTPPG